MAGTPTPLTRILGRLTADGPLTALLTGGIYDRELKQTGPGATPAAWQSTGGGRPKPALVLMPGTVTADPFYRGADNGWIDCFFYAFDDALGNGRTALWNALDMTRGLLFGWSFPSPNGTRCEVDAVSDIAGPFADQAEKERCVLRASVRWTGLWRDVG